MVLCTPFENRCLIYSDWALKSPCIGHQPDGIHPVQIHLIGNPGHLITTVFVIKWLSLYEFTLWGRDLTSVVRIRESPYYRGFF